MAKIKFKVEADAATIEVESEDYRDEYVEYCEAEGKPTEVEVPIPFVQEKVEQEFEDGTRDLDEALEHVAVNVTVVE